MRAARSGDEMTVFRPKPGAAERFNVMQAWEGTVTHVGEETFHADLRDRTPSGISCEEVAEIELDCVDPDDKALVVQGAVFDWYIGYRTDERGARQMVLELRFRRLPVWTRSEIARVEEASQMYDQFFEAGR